MQTIAHPFQSIHLWNGNNEEFQLYREPICTPCGAGKFAKKLEARVGITNEIIRSKGGKKKNLILMVYLNLRGTQAVSSLGKMEVASC